MSHRKNPIPTPVRTRGTSWLIPSAASSAAQSVIRPSRLVSSISGSGDPVASVSITRGGRVGQAVHTPVVSVPVYHQARVTRLVAADVPPLNAFPIILRRVRLDRDGKCQWGCIGGEKRLDSVQPSNCMGNDSAMRASVLLSLTGKDGNDGNLHREDDFRFHTSVQRWTDDIP